MRAHGTQEKQGSEAIARKQRLEDLQSRAQIPRRWSVPKLLAWRSSEEALRKPSHGRRVNERSAHTHFSRDAKASSIYCSPDIDLVTRRIDDATEHHVYAGRVRDRKGQRRVLDRRRLRFVPC